MNVSFRKKAWRAKSIAAFISLSLVISTVQATQKPLRFHGVTKNNNADASKLTEITKDNIGTAELYAIYNIPDAEAIPGKSFRPEAAMSFGLSISRDGILYLPTYDGRIHVLDLKKIDITSPNLDGTLIPRILDVYDLAAESRYTGDSPFDGDDIFINRIQPALSGNTIFAANNNATFAANAFFNGISADQYGIPIPTNNFLPESKGALLYAINRKTGNLKWKVVLDDNPHAMVTNSPVVHKGVVYVALSSQISGTLGVKLFGLSDFTYPTASGSDPFLKPGDDVSKSGVMFRNALVALDKKTGAILWKTYLMPEQNYRGPSDVDADGELSLWNGASSWGGGNFSIDRKRNQIYLGTGESFAAPLAASACEENRLDVPGADPVGIDSNNNCLDIDQNGNFIDVDNDGIKDSIDKITNVGTGSITSTSHPLPTSVVALDYRTGKIRWAKRLNGFDVWNVACIAPLQPAGFFTNFDNMCPAYLRTDNFALNFSAKDLDVAEQPMYVKKVKLANGAKKDMLIVTTKSAKIFALDPDNGNELWEQSLGVGSLFGGGILWGSSTDGIRMYTTSTTSGLNILDGLPSNVVSGSCPDAVFDPVTGAALGGVYAAINLKDGSIAWQRCLQAKQVDPQTGEVILDENGVEVLVAGWNEGPTLVANGVVLVPGASRSYGFDDGTISTQAEYVALDAENGQILKRLPLNKEGTPGVFRIQYQRPAMFGNMIIFGNGSNLAINDGLARRLVIYKIKKDKGSSDSDSRDSDSSDSDSSDSDSSHGHNHKRK